MKEMFDLIVSVALLCWNDIALSIQKTVHFQPNKCGNSCYRQLEQLVNALTRRQQGRSDEAHGNYAFGYDIVDGHGASNSRSEVGDGHGNKKGSYTLHDIDGRARRVDYVADGHGFRAVVNTNEPGTAHIAPAAAVIASPYAAPVAPVVAHAAPLAHGAILGAGHLGHGGLLAGHGLGLGHGLYARHGLLGHAGLGHGLAGHAGLGHGLAGHAGLGHGLVGHGLLH